MNSLEPMNHPSKVPAYEPTVAPSLEPSKESSGLPELEPLKEIRSEAPTPPPPCGLITMCDSGFLENCPGQEEFKIFEIAEYYVEPNSAPYPVSCIDDCNCLDTYYKGVGFQLGSHNDLKYDEINRENYVNTRVVNFNSEICSKRRQICASVEYNNYCLQPD